jgi:hypothetical protein
LFLNSLRRAKRQERDRRERGETDLGSVEGRQRCGVAGEESSARSPQHRVGPVDEGPVNLPQFVRIFEHRLSETKHDSAEVEEETRGRGEEGRGALLLGLIVEVDGLGR